MNPDLKVLRIAVVPTETDNGIDQSSTYEEIVACEETTYFSVPDYFKAQNDEDLPLMHWSFLLDSEKKVDCTGMNTDGIDMHQKAIHIAEIKRIIDLWDSVGAGELQLDCSPCVGSLGNVVALCEHFDDTYATVTVYDGEVQLQEYDMDYEDMEDQLVAEIHEILVEYDRTMNQNEKHSRG